MLLFVLGYSPVPVDHLWIWGSVCVCVMCGEVSRMLSDSLAKYRLKLEFDEKSHTFGDVLIAADYLMRFFCVHPWDMSSLSIVVWCFVWNAEGTQSHLRAI